MGFKHKYIDIEWLDHNIVRPLTQHLDLRQLDYHHGYPDYNPDDRPTDDDNDEPDERAERARLRGDSERLW